MPASLRFRTPRVIVALILREMGTAHGRTAAGYLWAILEPVAGIALLTLVFSLALRSPPLGTSFALFYATGMLPFTSYMSTWNKVATAVTFSRQLLVYPRVTFFDAVVARFLLNAVTQTLVAYIVITGVLLLQDTRAVLDFTSIAAAYAMALALGFGVGAINCVLFAMVPSWQRVWAITNRPIFFVSCIFYTFESLPDVAQDILWWNPLVHIIGVMRSGFYPTYTADYASPTYVLVVSGVLAAFGLHFLRRYHKKILNEL